VIKLFERKFAHTNARETIDRANVNQLFYYLNYY